MIYNKTYKFNNDLIKGLEYNSDMTLYQKTFYDHVMYEMKNEIMKPNFPMLVIIVGLNIHLLLYRIRSKYHMAVPFSIPNNIDQIQVGQFHFRDIYYNRNLKDGEIIIGDNLLETDNYILKKIRKEKLKKIKKFN